MGSARDSTHKDLSGVLMKLHHVDFVPLLQSACASFVGGNTNRGNRARNSDRKMATLRGAPRGSVRECREAFEMTGSPIQEVLSEVPGQRPSQRPPWRP